MTFDPSDQERHPGGERIIQNKSTSDSLSSSRKNFLDNKITQGFGYTKNSIDNAMGNLKMKIISERREDEVLGWEIS
jgi:hypothetical protein